jgi:type II secretory pathway predicted ATPase ExeA
VHKSKLKSFERNTYYSKLTSHIYMDTQTLLGRKAQLNPDAVQSYCTALKWDCGRLTTALYAMGLSHKETYLEIPNENLIELLAEFLTITGSSLFVIYGENGLGKSALKEFALRVFADDGRFTSFSIDNPGPFTNLQILRTIYTNLTDAKAPNRGDLLMAALEAELITIRRKGVTTLIWIDEGQKLNIEKIGLLRTLGDMKTPEGDLVCKVLIVGTMSLKEHLQTWITEFPEEAGAFDDRSGFYTMQLKHWTSEHIMAWWRLLFNYVAYDHTSTFPFTDELAELIFKISDGKPRSIVQLTQMAINHKAEESRSGRDRHQLMLSKEDVTDGIRVRIEGSK